ncbi:MAG: ester cyclase [Anaerolineae bacterium]|nr:ester cyclase [Anaerolineae bacterium]
MAYESKSKIEWKLSQVAPSEPYAQQRGINYRALPVDDSSPARAEMEALARRYADAINHRDFGTVMGMLDPGMVDHSVLGDPVSAQGIQQVYMTLLTSFPDLQYGIDHLYVDGDMVVLNGQYRGTSQAPYYNTPATGKPFATYVLEVFKVRDGKFVERHFWFDAMKIVREITAP